MDSEGDREDDEPIDEPLNFLTPFRKAAQVALTTADLAIGSAKTGQESLGRLIRRVWGRAL